MLGLAMLAGIVGACFLLFMMIILIFMCCGKQRVGFLSGRPFELTLTDDYYRDENDDSMREQYPDKTKKKKKKGCCCGIATTTWVRCTFILSGILFIIFAMLMVGKGITNLQDTVKSVHHSAANIEYITTEAQDIMKTGLNDIRGVAASVRDALEEELARDDFCPDDPEMDDNPQAADVRMQTENAVEKLRDLDSFVGEQVNDVADALTEVGGQAQSAVDTTGDVDLTDWQALLILIVFTLVPSMFVSAAILSHFDIETPCFTAFLDCCMMPLFILMVLFCVFVSCAMLVAASVNSDFCLPGGRSDDPYDGNSPDASVLRFLDAQGYTGEEDFVRNVAEYYIHQCQGEVEDPYTFMTDYLPDLQDAQQVIQALNNRIIQEGLILELSLYCNRDFDRMGTLLAEMQTIIDVMLEAMYRTLDLVSCRRIVPIYHRAVYDAACLYSVEGVMWVFASALIMAFFGLVMILFRAAYKNTKYTAVCHD